jgi:hypothetical protein
MPTRVLSLTLALLALVVRVPAYAGTFVENFDDGTIDAGLDLIAPSGFAITVAGQKLAITKGAGTGNGTSLLRSGLVLAGDFSASARVERVDLAGAAEIGLRAEFQGGDSAEIFFAGANDLKAAIKGMTITATESAASAVLQIRRDGNSIFCDIDTGTGFQLKHSLVDLQLGKANVRLEWFLRQTAGSSLAHTGRFDDLTVDADVIQGGGGGRPTATPAGPTPTPRPTPLTLDHFVAYGTKVAKGSAFFPLGPVTLLAGNPYDILQLAGLLLPADKNGEDVHDDATHLTEYRIKPGKTVPKFATLSDVRILNQCNDLVVQIAKPVSLLVPAAKDLGAPPSAPGNHERDHFVCFQAKPQKKRASGEALPKFPKGTQAEIADQFETRRYDLLKLTKLCLPSEKSGTPSYLKGPDKGQPASLAPATVRHPDEMLACYKTKLATSEIPQLGCGAVDPSAKGTKTPKQPKHTSRRVFVTDQLGSRPLDTKKAREVCVPSFVEFPAN